MLFHSGCWLHHCKEINWKFNLVTTFSWVVARGGPQIMWIQTLQFHYSILNTLVSKIQFYSKINPIPCNSMIFWLAYLLSVFLYIKTCTKISSLFSDTYVKKINFPYKNFHIRKSEILKTNAASVFFKIIINWLYIRLYIS